MQKITPFLWFESNAEEAVKFYKSIFDPREKSDATEEKPGPTSTFKIAGQEFIAFNGGPHFKFTEAISLFVHCTSQEEVDYYWDKLSAGGKVQQCGWLKDKYGLSWQIIPDTLMQFLSSPDRAKAKRVMDAMMKMVKIDVAKLEEAAAG